MKIETGEKIKCQDCGNEFRWIQRNSTIKPKYCLVCHNKRLLSKSNLAAHDERSGFKPGKYTPKDKKVRRTLNESPKDRFYKSLAWKWFSRYILIKETIDQRGTTVRCATCQKLLSVNNRNCHLGHYIKVFDGNSTNYSTAFLPTNVAPQCDKCNHYMGGRMDEMASYLESKHGKGTIEMLMQTKRHPTRLDLVLLEQISTLYRKKFHELLQERNIQNPWRK